MPNNQIQSGETFVNNQLVTADDLNNIAGNALLLKGAISEQDIIAETVSGDDELLINNISDTTTDVPRKATISQILNTGENAEFGETTMTEIIGSENFPMTISDGDVVVSTGYSYVSNNVVTVASPAHGLNSGDFIQITCTNVSGDSGSKFSGKYIANPLTTDSFTYTVDGTVSASTGSAIWKKSASVINSGSEIINGDAVIFGKATFNDKVLINSTSSLKIPTGTTAQRPSNPVVGEIRYNTTLSKSEIYDGTAWKALGSDPFNATGGSYVLEPSATTESATFTSTDGRVVTVTKPTGHDIKEGQIVEIIAGSGYSAYNGEYTAYDITTYTFKYRLTASTPAASATSISCTYRKSGKYKTHVFLGGGSFVSGDNEGVVELLVVGGGGAGSGTAKAGGGGGFLYLSNYKILANQSINVVVGNGGVSSQNGGQSSFGDLIAYGGRGGNDNTAGPNTRGSSGPTSINDASNPCASAFGVTGGGALREGDWGGDGYTSEITGTFRFYSYGGIAPSSSYHIQALEGNDGPENTGRGGKKHSSSSGSHEGGSGIVVVRYPYKLQQ